MGCNNKVEFTTLKKGYRTFCSSHCKNIYVGELIAKANLKKYNVRSTTQLNHIFQKQVNSGYKRKEYILPSGNKINVQGYEPFALDILLKIYNEKNIKTSTNEQPIIWYNFKNKKHRHFLDIYIESENKIIEVKSDYYYEKDIDKNLAKQKCCIEQGYNYEFWIIDREGNIKDIL